MVAYARVRPTGSGGGELSAKTRRPSHACVRARARAIYGSRGHGRALVQRAGAGRDRALDGHGRRARGRTRTTVFTGDARRREGSRGRAGRCKRCGSKLRTLN